MRMFKMFELETSSYCNRTCSSCLRNSHPDRPAVESWFTTKFLAVETIYDLFRQLVQMGFSDPVCLQHYNEPLLDPRIGEIARHAKSLNRFQKIFICTNGDYIDEEKAADLDGAFDLIFVALYMDQQQQNLRTEQIKKLFRKTALSFTGGVHIPTHFSPEFDVIALGSAYRNRPCDWPQERLIINHKGDCLLCCDDLTNNFGLGNINNQSLHELWFSNKHQQIIRDLEVAGGRLKYPHCTTCPRPGILSKK